MALIMEGVLSACYHVCPNNNNFQFGKVNLLKGIDLINALVGNCFEHFLFCYTYYVKYFMAYQCSVFANILLRK